MMQCAPQIYQINRVSPNTLASTFIVYIAGTPIMHGGRSPTYCLVIRWLQMPTQCHNYSQVFARITFCKDASLLQLKHKTLSYYISLYLCAVQKLHKRGSIRWISIWALNQKEFQGSLPSSVHIVVQGSWSWLNLTLELYFQGNIFQ